MLKTVVLYCSKTGYTRKYAEWIAQDLSSNAYDLNEVQNLKEAVTGVDTVIFGGGLYAIGINGLKKLMTQVNFEKISTLYVFCTGLSLDSPEVQEEIYKSNLKDIEKTRVKLYYYRGGFDFRKLGFMDRLLMRLLKLKIKVNKKKKPLTSDEKGMLAVFHRQVDFTDRRLVSELVSEVQSQQQLENF